MTRAFGLSTGVTGTFSSQLFLHRKIGPGDGKTLRTSPIYGNRDPPIVEWESKRLKIDKERGKTGKKEKKNHRRDGLPAEGCEEARQSHIYPWLTRFSLRGSIEKEGGKLK